MGKLCLLLLLGCREKLKKSQKGEVVLLDALYELLCFFVAISILLARLNGFYEYPRPDQILATAG